MSEIQKHLQMLGMKARDRVTGISGVVTSVGFDLYGCVQAVVTPVAEEDGKLKDSLWFDINRLEVTSQTPVMDRPDFVKGPVARGEKGAAPKPVFYKA